MSVLAAISVIEALGLLAVALAKSRLRNRLYAEQMTKELDVEIAKYSKKADELAILKVQIEKLSGQIKRHGQEIF